MKNIIEKLRSENNLRSLQNSTTLQKYIKISNKQYLNLSSNDYLGIGGTNLQSLFMAEADFSSSFVMSNPSSRLMTGNSCHYYQLENRLAELYTKNAALVFSSGFMLNSGVLKSLTKSDDLIIADKLVHASLIDGMRACDCPSTRFAHNDIKHLRSLLEKRTNTGETYVVLESIYSMDGDECPLKEIVELKKEFGFKIYLDEAHAFGVIGQKGLGVAERLGLISEVDYLVATFGKALASAGAFIVLDSLSREMVINRCRTLIFSTALPPIQLMWTLFAINAMINMQAQREHLHALSLRMTTGVRELTGNNTLSVSHIIPIIIGSNAECMALSERLREAGFWTTAVRYPTVAKGTARLRLSLNALMNNDDIDLFLTSIALFLAR